MTTQTIASVDLDTRDAILIVDAIATVLAKATWQSNDTLDAIVQHLSGPGFTNNIDDRKVVGALVDYFIACKSRD